MLIKFISLCIVQKIPIGKLSSESFVICVPLIILKCIFLLTLCLTFQLTLTLTRPDALMIESLLEGSISSLVHTLSLGDPKCNQRLFDHLPRPNTRLWQTPLVRSYGYSLSWKNSKYFYPKLLHYVVITWGATYFSVNPVLHTHTKHIELDYHFIRERVPTKTLDVSFVSNKKQLANILTKPLPTAQFSSLRSSLTICQVLLV